MLYAVAAAAVTVAAYLLAAGGDPRVTLVRPVSASPTTTTTWGYPAPGAGESASSTPSQATTQPHQRSSQTLDPPIPTSPSPVPGAPAPTVTSPSDPVSVMAGRTGPAGPAGPWNLVFVDEFNGAALDSSRWNSNWLGQPGAVTPPVNSYESANYSPANVAVAGGHLVLTATPTPSTADGTTRPDTSGLVNTFGHFQYTYGYAEARIQVDASPNAVFNWPAFWTDGVGKWPTTGEDDIFEPVQGVPRWHFTSSGGTSGGPLASSTVGWHTYGADWEPGSVTYYVDGEKVARTTKSITGAPMYLILNLAIGGRYSGPEVVPAGMEVDFVKVWQH